MGGGVELVGGLKVVKGSVILKTIVMSDDMARTDVSN